MAGKITTRDGFKQYCLRRIGFPVIELNLDEDQINDRVDEALKMFNTYHYDGRQPMFYVHEVTNEDMINKFITLPPDVIGVTKILPLASMFNTGSVFSLQYQIVLQDMWRWSSVQMTHYYQIYQYQQLMEQILIGQHPVRFTESDNRLYIDMNWTRVVPGQYIIVDGYRALNPDHISLLLDAAGDWVEGETVTGSNGATGTVFSIHKQSRQEIFVSDFDTTPFVVGSTVTGSTSGATATVKGVVDSQDVWNNRWLQNYCSALLELMFARNLTKYSQVKLPGGKVLNGEQIFIRAQQDVKNMENELFNSFNMPPMMMIG